jgi:FkbM family methyltransferase
MLFRFLEYLERQAQRAQGKGYGAKALTTEVGAALPFLPEAGAVVFDVGANKGKWAREMLAQAGSRVGRLYCFEPSRFNRAAILAIGDPRVTLFSQALSDAAGKAVLHFDAEGSGIASLAERRLDHYGVHMDGSEEVDVTTLDDVISAQGIARIDFAKFDVEGYEYRAFLGGEKAFTSGLVRAVAFELGGCNIDTRVFFRDFWHFLSERNYAIARINPVGKPHRIDRYREIEENFLIANFVAWRKDLFP